MKTKPFTLNPDHSYNLAPGTEVWTAKFGRLEVDVWQMPVSTMRSTGQSLLTPETTG